MKTEKYSDILMRAKSTKRADYVDSPAFQKIYERIEEFADRLVRVLKENGCDRNQSKIVVKSDYDADGVCFALIAKKVFPNARFELGSRRLGYGQMDLSTLKKGDVVICGDIGSSNIEQLREIRKSTGNSPFVIDHHIICEGLKGYPRLLNFTDSGLGADYCATGLMFELMGTGKFSDFSNITRDDARYAQICMAIGTIADMVNLNNGIDTNRSGVAEGLRAINEMKQGQYGQLGILLSKLDIVNLNGVNGANTKRCTATDIAFNCVPKINALGRIGLEHGAQFCFDTLTADVDYRDDMDRFINELILVNSKRKELTDERISADSPKNYKRCNDFLVSSNVNIIAINDLHEGIARLIAMGVLKDNPKPTIALYLDGETYKGSAANYEGYPDFIKNAEKCLEGLGGKVGGHSEAFGIEIPKSSLVKFAKRLNTMYSHITPVKKEEVFLDTRNLTPDMLYALEPFGTGNPLPVARNEVTVKNVRNMNGGYQSFRDDNGTSYFGKSSLKNGDSVVITGKVQFSSFRGKEDVRVGIDLVEPVGIERKNR